MPSCHFLALVLLVLVLVTPALLAQREIAVQTIRGGVRSAATQQPVVGASIQIFNADARRGAMTGEQGRFRMDTVAVGRYTLKVSCIGFETHVENIVVNSGRELVLSVLLAESYVQMGQVQVTGGRGVSAPVNESTIVSATQFTVEDVERYAGSRGDPARMAQNFAGIIGASSLRNDIIIRGGSPTQLLWRLDGLDIPNPNHFGTQGATGGPVGAINSGLLNNSDFVTGAFPAEYGDKLSGVFDLRTRNGNEEKYEFLAQLSYNGAEAGAEGPLGFMKGSFVANYRYSFLGLFSNLGMDLGIVGVPKYQDGMVKLHLVPGAQDQVNLTGLFGHDDTFMERATRDDVVTGDWNLQSDNNFYSTGATWQHLYSDRLFSRIPGPCV
jgi:hypothetical protein